MWLMLSFRAQDMSPQSRGLLPRLSSRDHSTWMLPHPQLSFCLWHLILGQFQLFTMNEANTRKAITGSQKQRKVQLILFCDSTGQRRGTREVGGGRQPGQRALGERWAPEPGGLCSSCDSAHSSGLEHVSPLCTPAVHSGDSNDTELRGTDGTRG